VAGIPVHQLADAVQPTEAQVAALSELGQASLTAAQNIRIACPAQAMLTAPGRLAAMQQRVEAMIAATAMIQPRLERFYGLLNDEQKARLNALAESQRKASSAPGDSGSPAQSMIRKSGYRFSLAQNPERICAEIMLKQKDRAA